MLSNKFKIIATDVDGTLLDDESQIVPANKEALLLAQKQGVHIALCSGRAYVTLAEFAKSLDLDPDNSHIIAFNGGTVFDGRQNQIHQNTMDKAVFDFFAEQIMGFKMATIIYPQINTRLCYVPDESAREFFVRYFARANSICG